MAFFFNKTFFQSLFAWIFIVLGVMAFVANKGNVLLLIFLGIVGLRYLFWGQDKHKLRSSFFSLFYPHPPLWIWMGGLFLLYILMSSFWGIKPLKSLQSVSQTILLIGIGIFAFVSIQTQKKQDFFQAKKGLQVAIGFLGGVLLLNIGYVFFVKYMSFSWNTTFWLFQSWSFLIREGFLLGLFFCIFTLYFSMTYTLIYRCPQKAFLILFLFLGVGGIFPFLSKYFFIPKADNIFFLHMPQSWQFLVNSLWGIKILKFLKPVYWIAFLLSMGTFIFVYMQTQRKQDFFQLEKSLQIGIGLSGSILLLNIGYIFLAKYIPFSWAVPFWPIRNWSFLTKEGFFLGFFFWIFALYFLKESSQKKFWIGALGIALICGLLPQRASFLGMIFGLVIYAFTYRWPKKTSLVLFLLLSIGIIFPFLGKYILIPKSDNILFLHMPHSWQHRFYIWNFVSTRIFEKPLLGWGFDASRHFPSVESLLHFYTSKGQISLVLQNSFLPLHPHNGFLQLWLEEGVIGLLLFLGMVGSGIRWFLKTLSSSQEKALFMGGIGMFFIPFCVSFGVWQTWWISMVVWYLIFWAFYKKCN